MERDNNVTEIRVFCGDQQVDKAYQFSTWDSKCLIEKAALDEANKEIERLKGELETQEDMLAETCEHIGNDISNCLDFSDLLRMIEVKFEDDKSDRDQALAELRALIKDLHSNTECHNCGGCRDNVVGAIHRVTTFLASLEGK